VPKLDKLVLITPLYLSVAWTLLISYHLFTETAVAGLITQINTFIPTIGFWLAARVDIIVFVYAFAWTFVLSSVIPSLLLGKERGVLVQFFVCLTLTFLAFVLLDLIELYAGTSLAQLLSFAFVFTNPFLAGLYLALPYLVMIGLDVKGRRRKKAKAPADFTETYVGSEEWVEQNYQEAQ
jgi:hypothetical protein